MFEFQELCREAEKLTKEERATLLAGTALEVIGGLNRLDLPGIHPVEILASFIVGSAVSDGSVSEKDFLNIYPSLVEAFGEACDIAGIERKLKVSRDVQKDIAGFTKQLMQIISAVDEKLYADIVFLCLLVTSADGKISLRERHYIRQLCKA